MVLNDLQCWLTQLRSPICACTSVLSLKGPPVPPSKLLGLSPLLLYMYCGLVHGNLSVVVPHLGIKPQAIIHPYLCKHPNPPECTAGWSKSFTQCHWHPVHQGPFLHKRDKQASWMHLCLSKSFQSEENLKACWTSLPSGSHKCQSLILIQNDRLNLDISNSFLDQHSLQFDPDGALSRFLHKFLFWKPLSIQSSIFLTQESLTNVTTKMIFID